MGGVVATGESNDELIDNLKDAKFILSEEIEKVFRKVDRRNFYPGLSEDAYSDLASKNGNLHISAACIYCEVLENLDLKRGQSFLNIGSGTGYLSTLAGMLLGPYGINHGVDIHKDVIQYSQEKVGEFIEHSGEFNSLEFCIPRFMLGNCLLIDGSYKYDRVYCGAGIPNKQALNKVKQLVKNHGVFIYPLEENLVRSTLIDGVWHEKSLLHVQFSNLVEPAPDEPTFKIYRQPPSLLEISRLCILECVNGNCEEFDALPIPNVLIEYLRFYRDSVNQPLPRKNRDKPPHIDLVAAWDV